MTELSGTLGASPGGHCAQTRYPGSGITAIVRNHPKAFRSLIYETSPKYYPALGKKRSPPCRTERARLLRHTATCAWERQKRCSRRSKSNPLRFGPAT